MCSGSSPSASSLPRKGFSVQADSSRLNGVAADAIAYYYCTFMIQFEKPLSEGQDRAMKRLDRRLDRSLSTQIVARSARESASRRMQLAVLYGNILYTRSCWNALAQACSTAGTSHAMSSTKYVTLPYSTPVALGCALMSLTRPSRSPKVGLRSVSWILREASCHLSPRA